MTNFFHSARSRITRAEAHITNIEETANAFVAETPYRFVVESDTDGLLQFHKVKLIKALPDGLTNVAADAIENLRSALDNAAYVIALAAGIYKTRGKAEPKSSYFPFAGSLAELSNVIKGRCRDLPEAIVALMRSFQPYKGGNDLLWSLTELCNANKHRLLVPIGVSVGPAIISMFLKDELPPTFGPEGPEWPRFTWPPEWNHEKQEGAFAVVGPDAYIEYSFDLTVSVAFADIGAVGGEPAVRILQQLLVEVTGIVNALEAESRKLGLFA
jgi:hypothetical protein